MSRQASPKAQLAAEDARDAFARTWQSATDTCMQTASGLMCDRPASAAEWDTATLCSTRAVMSDVSCEAIPPSTRAAAVRRTSSPSPAQQIQGYATAADGDAAAKAEAPQTSFPSPAQELSAKDAPMVCAGRRFIVSAPAELGIVGEYHLIDGECVNGRPAYKAAACADEARWPLLCWTPRAGGHWVFVACPRIGAARAAEGARCLLARSLQLSWTALPDELFSTCWTAAPWVARGRTVKVTVSRG